MTDYPVMFNIHKPEKFDRVQLALRLLILVILSLVEWVLAIIYLAIAGVAAIFISTKGGERFLNEDGPRMKRWLHWLLAIFSYVALLTDRFPTEKPEGSVTYEITMGGEPTVGSALLRLIFSIPSAFVLALLGIIGAIIWFIAAVMVLIMEDYPEGLYNFNLGVMRWEARLLAYHSSLVDTYPPFSLDTGQEGAGAAPAVPSPEPASASGGTE